MRSHNSFTLFSNPRSPSLFTRRRTLSIWSGRPSQGARRIRSLCSPSNTPVSFRPNSLYFATHLLAMFYIGKDASKKLLQVRDWIKNFTPSGSGASPSKNTPSPSQQHVGTLITNLSSIGAFPLKPLTILRSCGFGCSICSEPPRR